MMRGKLAVVLLASTALLLAACSGGNTNATSTTPTTTNATEIPWPKVAQPREIPEEFHNNFCALITPAEQASIGYTDSPDKRANGCAWQRADRIAGVSFKAEPKRDFKKLEPGDETYSMVTVDGFPAIRSFETKNGKIPPERLNKSCALYIAISDNQAINVTFTSNPSRPPVTDNACGELDKMLKIILPKFPLIAAGSASATTGSR